MKTTLSIKRLYIKGKYYYDGSVELTITNGLKYHDPILSTESGTLLTHISDIENKIAEYKRNIAILKVAHKTLKKSVKELKTLKVYP